MMEIMDANETNNTNNPLLALPKASKHYRYYNILHRKYARSWCKSFLKCTCISCTSVYLLIHEEEDDDLTHNIQT